MVMKIENYTGTADTFTFPHNPRTFDDPIDSNFEVTAIPFTRRSIYVSGGGIAPKLIVLSGHFDGSTKWDDYRNLTKHVTQNKQLKKLYFETDKFYLCLGKQCKQTQSGGRTNFIDYVATFEAVVGILLGDTQKTSGTNAGNTNTYVEEITGTVTSGSSDVTVSDTANSFSIPAGKLSTSDTITYKIVHMVDSGAGIKMTRYRYLEINGSEEKGIRTTGGTGIPVLAPSQDISTVTTTNLSSVTKKFRDGWTA